MAVLVFWGSVLLLIYIYLGYPLLCALLAGLQRRWPRVAAALADPELPQVSVLIAAYNEAAHIGATIENKLELDYPADRLQIVVVSDESDDSTDAVVGGYADRGVLLLRQEPRQGKTAALNLAQAHLTGDVIAFSDANSLWAPDALRHLVAPLQDPAIGYVTGRMVYRAPDGSLTGEGCSTYMRYENRLRWWETGFGSIVGVDGGIDVVRRALYVPMRADQLPDFVLPLTVRENGHRVVYAPAALLYEDALAASGDEFRMRVRVSLRALHALKDKRALLNPTRYGLFAWQLVSHKVLRYLAPVFQIGAFLANAVLIGRGGPWPLLFVAQLAFYGLAWLGSRANARALPSPARFAFYFNLLNAAALLALVRFLQGRKQVIWKPRT